MTGRWDELIVLWSAARAEANLAYDEWCEHPGADGYAAYRAAEDRADAAEDRLAMVASLQPARVRIATFLEEEVSKDRGTGNPDCAQ